jgi:LDH2 family malate/lactate/ureidoglycolate dehydrogenase
LEVVCRPEVLQEFTRVVFQAMGADADVAAETARHLIRANLSGHDSHGVIRIPQYMAETDRGDLRPSARPQLLREDNVTALVDAQRTFGQFSTAFALDWCIARALDTGLAAAAIRHSAHIGRLGEYTERAAERGLVAIVTVGMAGPDVGSVAPPGVKGRFLGTNPWSIGIPADGHPPVVFDAATSAIAEGKVRLARSRSAQLPPGSALDPEGNPTTDPEDFYRGGSLVPMGAPTSTHKGYGWSLMAALVGGLATIGDLDPSLAGARAPHTDHRGRSSGVFMVVIDPARFGAPGGYRTQVAATLTALREMPRIEGADVMVPGEPEVRMRAIREKDGIAVPIQTWDELLEIGTRFGAKLPVPD